jgi:hypothetical protein
VTAAAHHHHPLAVAPNGAISAPVSAENPLTGFRFG